MSYMNSFYKQKLIVFVASDTFKNYWHKILQRPRNKN